MLGGAASAIHHIGSTSVPGLAAKPVIDLLAEAPDLGQIDARTASLEADGYEAKGEHGIEHRRYFSRPEAARPKVHVHVFPVGHPGIARHLLFRDYLRAHHASAREYGRLKQGLARRFSRDRDAYQEAKAAFIEELHRKAGAWQVQGRTGLPRRDASSGSSR
jgi:GrpB-like predicted nucleotidyltransferase (UPF0157 family)